MTQKFINTLLSRFKMARLNFPPESPEILALALGKRARSEKHAELIVDTWLERSGDWPKPADIVSLAAQLENPDDTTKRTRESCPWCIGTGFRTVEGPLGTSAAWPCTHQPPSDADSRMGVPMAPAIVDHYLREREDSAQRHVAWLERRKAKPNDQFHRVSQADIDALLAGMQR